MDQTQKYGNILSTMKSLAHGRHTDGGTPRVNRFEESGGQAHWV